MIVSINPATGEELARVPPMDDAALEAAVERAALAQTRWRTTPLAERTALLRSIASVIRRDKPRLARLITAEMGKPLAEAEAEVEKCAVNCDFYAERAPEFLADRAVASSAAESLVVHDPLGVILAVMPWNYPLWQFFRFAAPALVAGNGALLKHANNVPQCAQAVGEILAEAGCPAGLVEVLMIDVGKVQALIEDRRVAAVTLTGSTEVGMIVAGQAGRALKKQVLELGGSDPFIVLADADLDAAAAGAVKARYTNAGQSCINAKRFIVVEAVADRFVELFEAKARALKVGDPQDPTVQIGPMARANLRDALHAQVERTLAAGGRLVLGGGPLPGPGYFYPPTIIDGVTSDMAAFREETFGPVAAIVRARDEEHAMTLANDTAFGLGAAIWTGDPERAKALARRLDAGSVFVNALVASDPQLPFGGIKHSGYGRELGEHGLKEFVNVKTLWVGATPAQ
jgi:succinate-semialdehyde dehydrogenase/glutarate-semialdehyde dehydrogenase